MRNTTANILKLILEDYLVKYIRNYLLFFGVNMSIAFMVFMWMPDYRDYLIKEDHLIENLSTFFFFSTFFIGFIFSVKNKKNRKILIILSALGLLGFLEELSFGERLFNLNMPVVYNKKIDAVHDLFDLGFKVIKALTYSYAFWVYSLIGSSTIVAIIAVFKFRTKVISLLSKLYGNQTYILALIFVSLVFVALIIDLEIWEIDILFFIEELFEMNAALALLFCCLSLFRQGHENPIFKKQMPSDNNKTKLRFPF